MGKQHWEAVYADRSPERVSWYQREPALSLALIEAAGVAPDEPVIDVGGGASLLVDRLLERGFTDVTVLDLAETALAAARARLGALQERVHWKVADACTWEPAPGTYALWHDRAVFHFLVTEADRRGYLRALARGLRPGGHAVFATFAPSGPERCSGLPVQRYSVRDLQATLGSDFTLLDSRPETHHTPTNTPQDFQWCLFRFAGEAESG